MRRLPSAADGASTSRETHKAAGMHAPADVKCTVWCLQSLTWQDHCHWCSTFPLLPGFTYVAAVMALLLMLAEGPTPA
jgi:hypothetical protein